MTDYPYDHGDLLAEPHLYAYPPFEGVDFLAAWQRAREPLCRLAVRGDVADAAPRSSDAPSSVTDGSEPVADGRLRTDELVGRLATDPVGCDDVVVLLARKFDVAKRFWTAYQAEPPHRRTEDAVVVRDLDLYLTFGEAVEARYGRRGDIRDLNVLCKLLDTVSAYRDRLAGTAAARAGDLAHRERAHVTALAADRGVTW